MEEDQSAQLINLEKYKLGKLILQTRDGTQLYLTRDLGEAIRRWEAGEYESHLYVVGSEQDLHFKQLFKLLELCGYEWAKRLRHISHGKIMGMSSRKGKAIFLDDLLETAQSKMLEVMKKNEAKYEQVSDPEKTAFQVGMSAIVVQDMSAQRVKHYTFDWDRMLSFEGDTGPYLQYAHARLCSIERNSELEQVPPPMEQIDLSLLHEPSAQSLVQCLAQWPDVVRGLVGPYEPVTVVTYMFKLCRLISSSYDELRVKGREPELRRARVTLYWCAKTVLSNALKMIGLDPLERM